MKVDRSKHISREETTRAITGYEKFYAERDDAEFPRAKTRKRIRLTFDCGHSEVRVDFDNPRPRRGRCRVCIGSYGRRTS